MSFANIDSRLGAPSESEQTLVSLSLSSPLTLFAVRANTWEHGSRLSRLFLSLEKHHLAFARERYRDSARERRLSRPDKRAKSLNRWLIECRSFHSLSFSRHNYYTRTFAGGCCAHTPRKSRPRRKSTSRVSHKRFSTRASKRASERAPIVQGPKKRWREIFLLFLFWYVGSLAAVS